MKLRRFGAAWDYFGQTNALGAILTGTDGRLASWDAEAFFAAGKADADRFVAALKALAPAVSMRRALDFGCGVGRVTRALADHFESVVGVDVSGPMIERARQLNADPRCDYVLNKAPHLACVGDGEFTVVYSRLVLQHIRPTLVRRYIPELVRVLAPGGVLMFQLPDVIRPDTGAGRALSGEPLPVLAHFKRRVPWPVVVAWRDLKGQRVAGLHKPEMQMYGVAPDDVLGAMRSAGGRLLDVRPDSSHGCSRAAGFEYWMTR